MVVQGPPGQGPAYWGDPPSPEPSLWRKRPVAPPEPSRRHPTQATGAVTHGNIRGRRWNFYGVSRPWCLRLGCVGELVWALMVGAEAHTLHRESEALKVPEDFPLEWREKDSEGVIQGSVGGVGFRGHSGQTRLDPPQRLREAGGQALGGRCALRAWRPPASCPAPPRSCSDAGP
jgi:hypothetical protein